MAVDTTELDAAFSKWLRERRTDLSLRQQFWLAFEAGAKYALNKFSTAAGLTTTCDEETCPKCGAWNVSPFTCKEHGDVRNTGSRPLTDDVSVLLGSRVQSTQETGANAATCIKGGSCQFSSNTADWCEPCRQMVLTELKERGAT